jgi:hypothetical protein
MKTILIAIGIMALNLSFGAHNPTIKTEIEEKVQPDLSQFSFNEDHENFIVVSFTVNDNHIEIIDLMGSSDELMKIMKTELNELTVDNIYPTDDIYNFKFIFTKQ